MIKEAMKNGEITPEVVDEFHRTLCPQCNGRCHFGRSYCGYDFTHKVSPEPDINSFWREYITALKGLAAEQGMDLAETYRVMKAGIQDLTPVEMEQRLTFEELWRNM